jgi:hypothetical protein
MAPRAKSKPKLTDAERHARFVETAREVGVDESPGAFDRAFDRVVKPTKVNPPNQRG